MSESKSSGRKINWAKRRQQATEMRLEGYTYEEIGDALGIGRSAACRMVNRVLDNVIKNSLENVELLRELELMRCDKLQMAYWDQAMNGDLEAAKFIIKAMERRAKLSGLDKQMPKEVPANDEINPYDGLTEEAAQDVWKDILAQADEAAKKNIVN